MVRNFKIVMTKTSHSNLDILSVFRVFTGMHSLFLLELLNFPLPLFSLKLPLLSFLLSFGLLGVESSLLSGLLLCSKCCGFVLLFLLLCLLFILLYLFFMLLKSFLHIFCHVFLILLFDSDNLRINFLSACSRVSRFTTDIAHF